VPSVSRMEFVDVYRRRRPIGHAFMNDDRLEPEITPRRPYRATCARAACPHDRTAPGFAHRRSRDEHWPIVFCEGCLTILAGRDPLNRNGLPRWKHHERNRVAARWSRQWPKSGRPRREDPPETTVWPDAA